jgi:hypothetical protein
MFKTTQRVAVTTDGSLSPRKGYKFGTFILLFLFFKKKMQNTLLSQTIR